MDYAKRSLDEHRAHRGKLAICSRIPLETQDDLSTIYTPGVAAVSQAIAEDVTQAKALTMKGNSVAVVTDGSAVLGLGNIGPEAALPVMEGKAILFAEYADIVGVPICLGTQDPQEIVRTCRLLAPTFGGINLEDISAPRCFEIEDALQDLGIPVMHDDQHGTAIVVLAALLNAMRVTGRSLEDLTVVVNGAGAAGSAIAKLMCCVGQEPDRCVPVKQVLVCDSKGILSRQRTDLNPQKQALLAYTNRGDRTGTLRDALKGADVFIGVSKGNLLKPADIRTMADDAIVFGLANPDPEILPDLAREGGAAVVGTGRSDFPNQVNNVLAFPGIFRGALDAGSPVIDAAMKMAAAHALAATVEAPTVDRVLPSPLDRTVAPAVAEAVRKVAMSGGGVSASAAE